MRRLWAWAQALGLGAWLYVALGTVSAARWGAGTAVLVGLVVLAR